MASLKTRRRNRLVAGAAGLTLTAALLAFIVMVDKSSVGIFWLALIVFAGLVAVRWASK